MRAGLGWFSMAVLLAGALLNADRAVAQDTNTHYGTGALQNNVGEEDTGFGYQALFSNSSAGFNTAMGANALYSNTGYNNTATGAETLTKNSSGKRNTATGTYALYN